MDLIRRALLALTALTLWATTALACPFCNDALLDPGQAAAASRMAHGYLFSIIALIAVPLALVVGSILWVVRASRPRRTS